MAVVDRNVDKHGTRAAAEAYLRFLWTSAAQQIIARRFYRPIRPDVLARAGARFPHLATFTVDNAFGGWAKAQAAHFADGGLFDRVYRRA